MTLDLDHRRNQIVSFNLVCPAPCMPTFFSLLLLQTHVHATCWLHAVA